MIIAVHDKAATRARHAAQARRLVLVQPVQVVGDLQRLLRCGGQLSRAPHRHDVVPGLLTSRKLDQGHGSRAKTALRLHPNGRAAVVVRFEVFEIFEIAITLREAKALELVRLEKAQAHVPAHIERPPDRRSALDLHLQTVGVMHLRPEIVRLRVRVLAKPVHAREWSDAEHLHRLAEMQRGPDLHQRGLAGRRLKLIGSRHTRAIQQREQFEGRIALLRLRKPEMREIRELLRLTTDRIHRHASRGDAVAELRRHRAKITGSHEDHELKRPLHQRVRREDFESRVALGILRSGGQLQVAILELRAIKRHQGSLAGIHAEKVDRLLKHPARVEELHAETFVRPAKQRLVPQKLDLAVPVVFQPFKKRIELLRRSRIRLQRELRGDLFEVRVRAHILQFHLGMRGGGKQGRAKDQSRPEHHHGRSPWQQSPCQSTQ